MYEVFKSLLNRYNITAYRVCKETGLTTSTISNWKAGRYIPKQDKLQKIADYFGVRLEYLMTGKDTYNSVLPVLPVLTPITEKDIYLKLQDILSIINNTDDTLFFRSKKLDDNTKRILKSGIESVIEIIKIHTKTDN